MKIPRLAYWDHFFILEEDGWRQLTPQEIVEKFNGLADRYEVILTDMEEIVVGHPSRTNQAVHPRTANTA